MGESTIPYILRPMREYLDAAAAGTPTPGGGSVSALAGALGTTMASMAANFTIGKKKFKDVEQEAMAIASSMEKLRARLTDAMQKDTEAYSEVGAAYAMPKLTAEERSARAGAIQKALRTAMGPPLEVVRASLEALRLARRLADIANPNLITDVGVAAILLEAAAKGAYLNVVVNLAGLDDAELVRRTSSECTEALAEAARLQKETSEIVEATLRKGAG